MNNSDKPAYPQDGKRTWHPDTTGLTKREYFAAMAMQGILANAEFLQRFQEADIHVLAVKNADYLLQELEKK